MNPFPQEQSFTPGDVGFDDKDAHGLPFDLLGRKATGQRLSDLLERVEHPLVVALDGGWGCGKSHFLKIWTGAHTKELGGTAQVIYFDAFAHDFLDDPLVSLVARLASPDIEKTWGSKAIAAVKRAAYPLARGVLRLVAAGATAGATEVAGPVLDGVLDRADKATQASIDEFWQRETSRIAAMDQFRTALVNLTLPKEDGAAPRKIIFIIDELDRCRPDYALTLLEIVKHFFAVPNVHFVLGTNMQALENSVRARYGAGIRAAEYLTRFVHLIVRLPEDRDPDGNGPWERYLDHHGSTMKIGRNEIETLKDCLQIYERQAQIGLRDIQRILSRAALFPRTYDGQLYGEVFLAHAALVLAVLSPDHFTQLRRGKLGIDEVVKLFPTANDGSVLDRFASGLHHFWQRALMDDPGEDALQATANAFPREVVHDRALYFSKLWANHFDLFRLPEAKS